MSAVASQITSLWIVYSTVYSGADQRRHQGSASHGLCEGNSTVTGEFPAQRASNAENVSIWWRHPVLSSPIITETDFCKCNSHSRIGQVAGGGIVYMWVLPGSSDPYIRQYTIISLVRKGVYHLFGANPLSEPILTNCYLKPGDTPTNVII